MRRQACFRHSNTRRRFRAFSVRVAALCLVGCLALLVGCKSHHPFSIPSPPDLLGSNIDQIMQQQEDNAEQAKFVIYMHEFELNKPEWELRVGQVRDGRLTRGHRLSPNGEDHLRQIAALLREGAEQTVIVERNQTSVREDTEYRYAVHFGDDLDRRRRQVVVETLRRMGVDDADQRVIVAPAFSEGYDASEAAMAYNATFGQRNMSGADSGFGLGLFGF